MGKDIKKILQKELKGFHSSGQVVSIVAGPDEYKEVVKEILIITTKMKSKGIYVTLNKANALLKKDLEKEKIDHSKLYFIDGSGNKGAESENVFYVQGPKALTEISLATMAAIDTGKFDFLFLDSLSTLLIYNDLKTTEKFAHFIMNKLKGFNMITLIIALNEENSKHLVSVVAQFSDKLIRI